MSKQKELYTEKGNLKWKDGIKDSEVVWEPNPNGNWAMGIDPFDKGETPHISKIHSREILDEMKEVAKYYGRGIIEEEKQKCFIAIDNGVTGSIGIIREDGIVCLYKTPVKKELNYTKAKAYITRVNALELIKILSIANPLTSHVIIERPMVNPGRFVATISAIRALEATQTVLEQLGLSYSFIDSKEWQKAMLPSGLKGDELKSASLDVGNRLFPQFRDLKHPDRDGILMAQYCKNKNK